MPDKSPLFKTKSYIENIEPYKQGKSEVGVGNIDIVKLSSNENALGTSPEATEAYKSHAPNISRYADGSCAKLRRAIANKYKIEANNIVCGAGSDEIISLLIQSFASESDEIIYSNHGFLMYAISAQKFGVKAVSAKEENLTTSVENIVNLVNGRTKMIFIANPNNPTGSYINKDQIQKLIASVPKNIIIVLDLAYGEFVDLPESEYPDVFKLVRENENIVMTRTFSKIYGLASLRLGWSYSCQYIADVLNKSRGPFNVSGSAIAAGIAAINDEEFVAKSVTFNKKWLRSFKQEFKDIGLKSYKSIANFILIDFEDVAVCQKANLFLLENGIILREMSGYKLPSCLRLTIGTDEENYKLIKFLKQFLDR